jgi:hypothetical protein
MDIQRLMIPGQGFVVPSVVFAPERPVGTAIIAHGYGGCKEEQLGLAWRVAHASIRAVTIDLRGHGEHPLPLDKDVLDDLNTVVHHYKQFGQVAAIGHSLGGRLALISDADFAIGISPPLDTVFSERTQEQLKKMRSHRVRPEDHSVVFDVLRTIPCWHPTDFRRSMIIFGSRDVPEIVHTCRMVGSTGATVIEIDRALHGDTYCMEIAFEAVVKKLLEWFGEQRMIRAVPE